MSIKKKKEEKFPVVVYTVGNTTIGKYIRENIPWHTTHTHTTHIV